MRHVDAFGKIVQWVVSLCIPVVIVGTPLYVLVRPGFIHYEYGRRGFPSSERFSAAERARLSDVIVSYLRHRATWEEMATMRTDDGQIALRPEEVQHLVDVRRVTDAFFVAHGMALVLGILAGLALWRTSGYTELALAIRRGVWGVFGLAAVVGLAAVLDFDTFFTRFHQIFFPPNSWVFYLEDTLIQLYPLPLWIDATVKIVLMMLIQAAALIGFSWVLGSRR